ncbi:MAG: hypothetical protein VX939_01590 [Pseudomonadota bacterium]|nr:hypothetical protein [Pseudomonadota bacterium]
MNMFPILRLSVLAAVITGLAACGGGGGGSSSSGGSSVTPAPPPAGELLVDPDGYGSRLAPMRSLSDLNASSELFTDIQAIETFIDSVSDALSADISASASMTATSVAECSIANENLVISDTRNSAGVGDLLIEFLDCMVPVDGAQYSLDGTVRTTTRNLSGDQVQVIERYNLDGYELTGAMRPIALRGSQTITARARSSTDIEVVSTTESLEFLRDDVYVAIRGSRIAIRETSNRITLNIQSEIIGSSINGYLILDTPESVVATTGTTCPSRGKISVVGDGRIDSAYGVSNSRGAGVEVTIGGVTTYNAGCNVGVPGVSDKLSATQRTPEDERPKAQAE